MPRSVGTVTLSMGFNPNNARVRQMEVQAREGRQSLSAYVKQLVLDLTGEGRFVPLHFKEASHVSQRLEQEAQSLEMSVEDYILALLSDRHRALYGGKTAPSLWYPRVQPVDGVEEVPTPKEEEIDLAEAMKTVSSIMDFYNDQEGF
jgi:hypothetical protein